jgi:hypothetical protein
MKGMATEKAAHGLGGSFQDAITFDSIAGILRAGWRKPACGGDPGRNNQLVASQESKGNSLDAHVATPSSDSNSVLNSSNSLVHAEWRGFTTISTPRGTDAQARRRISRTRLRIRFRLTATPIFRGVVRPTLLCSRPLASTKTTKERDTFFAPPL